MSKLTVPFDPHIGPIADVIIAPTNTIRSGADAAASRARTYKALVDTGAEFTCISQRIACDIGLRVTGIARMASASGTHNANLYMDSAGSPAPLASPCRLNLFARLN